MTPAEALGQLLMTLQPHLAMLERVTWSASTARSEDGRLTLTVVIEELPAVEVIQISGGTPAEAEQPLPQVNSPAEAADLPPGTHFLTHDGRHLVRHAGETGEAVT